MAAFKIVYFLVYAKTCNFKVQCFQHPKNITVFEILHE